MVLEQVTGRHKVCHPVNQASSQHYHLLTVQGHTSVVNFRRTVSEAGHLKEAEGQLRIHTVSLVTHALLADLNGHVHSLYLVAGDNSDVVMGNSSLCTCVVGSHGLIKGIDPWQLGI